MSFCGAVNPAPNIPEPNVDCSALELIAPDIWVTMDGWVIYFLKLILVQVNPRGC